MGDPELLTISELTPAQFEEVKDGYNKRNKETATDNDIIELYKDTLFLKKGSKYNGKQIR